MTSLDPGREFAADAVVAAYQPLGSPWFRANMITSLDGVIAIDGSSQGLSSAIDREVYWALRSMAAAVVVGAKTANYRGYTRLDCPLVIVSNSGAIQTPVTHPIVVTTTHGARRVEHDHPQARLIVAGADEVDLRDAYGQLLDRGLDQLLCEGGPTLLASLISADLIDELCLTFSPRLVGHGPRLFESPESSASMHLHHLHQNKNWIFARYLLKGRGTQSVGE